MGIDPFLITARKHTFLTNCIHDQRINLERRPFFDKSCQAKFLSERYREWERELAEGQVALVPVQDNLIDIVWADERPATPCNPLRIHSDKYAGSSWNEKLNAVRQKMSEQGVELLLLSTLDEIACKQ